MTDTEDIKLQKKKVICFGETIDVPVENSGYVGKKTLKKLAQ